MKYSRNIVERLGNESDIQKWEVFLMMIKTMSIYYSKIKNKVKRRLKDELIKQILKMEENEIRYVKKTIDYWRYWSCWKYNN